MNFTLRQLEIFIVTAHTENISTAAQTLHMSQSAASGALKTLEDQFDIALFDRIGKRLRLSEFGRLIRPQAEALIEQAKSFQRQMSQKQELGPIQVGATLTIGSYLAVDLFGQFVKNNAVEVSLTVANTADICAKVVNFELDVGMVEGEVNHQQLIATPWRSDDLVVFAAPDHPLVGKLELDDSMLIAEPWIVREKGSGTRQAFDFAMKGILPQFNILLELEHTEAIKRAVETGLGLGCLSRLALAEDFRLGRFIPLSVAHRDFTRRLYLIRHKDKTISKSVQAWLDLCEQQPSISYTP